MAGDDSSSWALALLLGAAAILAASGVPGLFLGWRSTWGARIATVLTVAGSLVGLAGAALALAVLPATAPAGLRTWKRKCPGSMTPALLRARSVSTSPSPTAAPAAGSLEGRPR